jgi:hypothetical protein
MIQHLSQSTSKRRNLQTKETIRSGKILRRDQFTLNFKIEAAKKFLKEKQNFPKTKAQSFLDNNLECGNGKKLRESTFRGWIKDFEKNKAIINQDRIRKRGSNFPDVEEKIVKYLNFRKERFSKDKCGTSYDFIRNKALEFSEKFLEREQQIFLDLKNSLGDLQDNEDIEKAVDDIREKTLKSENRIKG